MLRLQRWLFMLDIVPLLLWRKHKCWESANRVSFTNEHKCGNLIGILSYSWDIKL